MATSYNEGSRIELKATFKDKNGNLANPTAITLRVRNNAGVITTYTITDLANPSVGVWTKNIDLNTAGEWRFWFEATDGVIAADGDSLLVKPKLT